MLKKYMEFYDKYFSCFLGYQILGMIILVVYSMSSVIYPYFMQRIIDEGISTGNMNKLISYSVLMIAVICISIIVKYIRTLFFFRYNKKVSNNMRGIIIKNIFNYNSKFFTRFKVGEIISLLEQDVQIDNQYSYQ